MLSHEGGRCYLEPQTVMSSSQLGVRSKTKLTSRWNSGNWKERKVHKETKWQGEGSGEKYEGQASEMPELRGLEKEGHQGSYGSHWKGNAGLRGAGRFWKQQLRYLFMKKSLSWFEPRVKNDRNLLGTLKNKSYQIHPLVWLICNNYLFPGHLLLQECSSTKLLFTLMTVRKMLY